MSRILAMRECAGCGAEFLPKPGGYNAVYCHINCKNKRYRHALPSESRKSSRRRSFERVKADPERYARHCAQSDKARRAVRDWLANYKLERGCVDCGFKAHYAALQLDHEGPKSIEIAACRSSVKRLLEEIEKGRCKVRCANCHSIKTWERKQTQLKEDQ